MDPNRNSRIAVGGGLFLMLSGTIGGDGLFLDSRIRFYLGLVLAIIGVVMIIRERWLRKPR